MASQELSPYSQRAGRVCDEFLDRTRFAYVTATFNNTGGVSGYAIDHATGALTSVGGLPAGPGARSVAVTRPQ